MAPRIGIVLLLATPTSLVQCGCIAQPIFRATSSPAILTSLPVSRSALCADGTSPGYRSFPVWFAILHRSDIRLLLCWRLRLRCRRLIRPRGTLTGSMCRVSTVVTSRKRIRIAIEIAISISVSVVGLSRKLSTRAGWNNWSTVGARCGISGRRWRSMTTSVCPGVWISRRSAPISHKFLCVFRFLLYFCVGVVFPVDFPDSSVVVFLWSHCFPMSVHFLCPNFQLKCGS